MTVSSAIAGLLDRAPVQRLFAATRAAGGEARLVGGVVRDCLSGVPLEDLGDLDMASTLSPAANLAMAENAGLKVVPTGLAYGTLTFVIDGVAVEVTSLRRDVATDGRRAVVRYSENWREDAARRDFTVNALYLAADGTICDFFGGQADLVRRRIRFIGDAKQRIAEDYLRVLRYFRFQAQLNGTDCDEADLAACRAAAAGLTGLSVERVQNELKKLLSQPDPSAVIRRMSALGILSHILPGLNAPSRLFEVIACENTHRLPADPLRRLAAWAQTMQGLKSLKLSKAENKRLAGLFKRADAPLAERLYRHGAQAVLDTEILSGTLTPERRQRIETWENPVFPLKGKDLRTAGWQTGPALGQDLALAEHYWIESGFQADKDALIAYLKRKSQ